ncbi:MAG TPA: HlyD family type I secretion periplasmic adaptor subunit [Methyloceanibacter sp.]|nr:HlyD family type I secretion periplasmic adaptor subunit [Methyloceanibacter sp.]
MASTPHQAPQVQQSIRRHVRIGLVALVLVGGGLGAWAAIAKLSGAVVAGGTLVVESSVKKVQHPTGGVVGELLVKEGSHVEAGEIVIKLDETQTRANLQVVANGIDELLAREARLDAERNGATKVEFPEQLLSRISEPNVEKAVTGEQRHFGFRLESREGQKKQLRERIDQLKQQIQGYTEQTEAKKKETDLVKRELVGVRTLYDKQLVPETRINALEREAARLEGERGQLIAAMAEAKGKISEVELQMIQIDQDMRSQDAQEIADVRAKLSELTERRVAAEDQLRRVDIRAPLAGTVHQLSMHTVGGVIGPGEQIMLIVPHAEALTVEAKVSPADIDQLQIGQIAALRFSAFNQQTTPELFGNVSRIAADLTEDQRSGASYYVVRIAIDADSLRQLQGLKLVAGMPVEVFIQTGSRNVLSYLIKPLEDQAARAFREE